VEMLLVVVMGLVESGVRWIDSLAGLSAGCTGGGIPQGKKLTDLFAGVAERVARIGWVRSLTWTMMISRWRGRIGTEIGRSPEILILLSLIFELAVDGTGGG
jgi:hypothetical protein